MLFGSAVGARTLSLSRRFSSFHPLVELLESRAIPSVITPVQMRHAYGFDQIFFNINGQTVAGDGTGQTIAIVDAYDDPNIASDLRYFDQTFGLPNPSFTKVMPQGQPARDSGWALEIALDVEWAHSIAPRANILLVEARTSSLSDLLGAVDYARRQANVVTVSMSWGAAEFSGETYYDGYFRTVAGHGGVTFVASSGDSGARYGPEWPAISANVLAVGGTHLNLANSSGSYGSESGWSGSGGGYSVIVGRPPYQNGFQSNSHRTNPDVAYDGDPNSGVYVYDTVPYSGYTGWFQVGGTSAGSPQWAALVAIADQGRALLGRGSLDGATQTLYALYQLASSAYSTYYHDVTTGSNGYSAHGGYDLVTGLGSPKANALVAGLVSYAGSGGPSGFFGPSGGSETPGLPGLIMVAMEESVLQARGLVPGYSATGIIGHLPATEVNAGFSRLGPNFGEVKLVAVRQETLSRYSAISGETASPREQNVYDDQIPYWFDGEVSGTIRVNSKPTSVRNSESPIVEEHDISRDCEFKNVMVKLGELPARIRVENWRDRSVNRPVTPQAETIEDQTKGATSAIMVASMLGASQARRIEKRRSLRAITVK